MQRRRAMTWRRVGKAAQALVVQGSLLCFTFFLALKIVGRTNCSWWSWAPCHAIVATPLLISFELLLCIYLQGISVKGEHVVNLKLVFVPLLAFEIIILVDNFRMCRTLMPGDEESMTGEAIWETLPHFWVAVSMVFLIAATTFTLLKLCGKFYFFIGDVGALGWWDLFINFAEHHLELNIFPSLPYFLQYLFWKVLLSYLLFQDGGRSSSFYYLMDQLIVDILQFHQEHMIALLSYIMVLDYWVMEVAKKNSYDTLCRYPPEAVRKMPKKDLAEEVWKLQKALGEQAEITKYSQQEYENLQMEKLLCSICFEGEICMVLLPCQHHTLCKSCSEKCKKCSRSRSGCLYRM